MPSSAPTEGGISKDNVHPVRLGVTDIRAGQGVIVADEGGIIDTMEEHVGDAEHVGELFLLRSTEALLHPLLIVGCLHVALAHMSYGAREKATGATGRIKEDLAGLGVYAVSHEGGDSPGRVVFARIAGALEVVEYLLVDVAEVLPLGQIVKINGGNSC